MTIRSTLRNWFFKEEPKMPAYEPPDLSELDGSRMRETMRKVLVSNEVAEAVRATALEIPDAEYVRQGAARPARPVVEQRAESAPLREEPVGTEVPTWKKPAPVVSRVASERFVLHSKPEIVNLDKADAALKKAVDIAIPKHPLGIRITITRTDESGKDVRVVADIRNEEDLKSFNCSLKGYAIYVKKE